MCFLSSSKNNFLVASHLSVFLSPLKGISKVNSCNQEGWQYSQRVTVSLGVLSSMVPACVQG